MGRGRGGGRGGKRGGRGGGGRGGGKRGANRGGGGRGGRGGARGGGRGGGGRGGGTSVAEIYGHVDKAGGDGRNTKAWHEGHAYVAKVEASAHDQGEMRKLFQSMDKDFSGTIDMEDVKATFTDAMETQAKTRQVEAMVQMLERFDANRDNKVSVEEFESQFKLEALQAPLPRAIPFGSVEELLAQLNEVYGQKYVELANDFVGKHKQFIFAEAQ